MVWERYSLVRGLFGFENNVTTFLVDNAITPIATKDLDQRTASKGLHKARCDTTQQAPTNRHRSQHFRVRIRGSELAILPCHGPTSWIYSLRDFPKWAEPEIFGLQSVEESGLAINSIRKLPRPILKTEIVRRTEPAYWVVSQRALCSPS